MSRQFALITIALFVWTAAAGAADLSAKKAPAVPPPAVFTWGGFYLGLQGGGGWAMDKVSESAPFFPPTVGAGSVNESGIIGGAHAGYNWQEGSLVYGLEGDFEGTSLSNSSNCVIQDAFGGAPSFTPGPCNQIPNMTGGISFKTALPWQGSERVRLGYAFGNLLVYGTGGVAIAGIDTRYTEVVSLLPIASSRAEQSFRRTALGVTLGAGVEYAIDANWSARAEYRFTDFGKDPNPIDFNHIAPPGVLLMGYRTYHSVEENAVLFGISYKFGAL
jgi:outer membrane immunogenic protein